MHHFKNITLAEAIFGNTEDIIPPNILNSLLSSITPREEKVLRKRFGIDENGEKRPGCTLKEVGKELGVGRERIRQIEAKALRKLRHPRRRKLLESFTEF